MAATRAQLQSWNVHRQVCIQLGIPQSTLNHKHLKGSFNPPSPTGNRVYKGPPPAITFAGGYASSAQVWLIYQPFIRGEERPDDFAPGILSIPVEEAQWPAIDDAGNLLVVANDDFFTTPDKIIWRILNPVISPGAAHWTSMIEMQR